MSINMISAIIAIVVLSFCVLFFALLPKLSKLSKDLNAKQSTRHCLNCGHTGMMKTYFDNARNLFQLVILYLCGLLPGLIYQLYGAGKRICPNCKSTNLALH